MYRIGEFSRITSLSVKALRYCDSEGLLAPSGRGENGYRLYSAADYERARLIALLRELEFSIAEIRDVLAQCESEDDLPCFLAQKREQILAGMRRERALVRALDRRLADLAAQTAPPCACPPVRRTLPAVRVAAVRYHGAWEDSGRFMAALQRAAGPKACGPPFHVYRDEGYVEQTDLLLCLPVRAPVTDAACTNEVLPAVRALCTVHTGPYGAIGIAYKTLLDSAAQQGLTLGTPSRLIYHRGPGMIFKGDPARYRTEVAVPFSETVCAE